jgi:hypothetical protein
MLSKMGIFMTYRFLVFFLLINLFLVAAPYAGEQKPSDSNQSKDHWALLCGYGVTHPGLGDTRTRVEDVDLIFQYGHFLSEAGRSWYKVRHKLLIEIPFYIVYHPESAIMTGINFLASWDFTASKEIIPYFFVGGGFMYTNLNVPELGTDYNGNYQGGIGIHYVIGDNTSIEINYRYHHISNADTAQPNDPLNSTKFLVGVSFLL